MAGEELSVYNNQMGNILNYNSNSVYSGLTQDAIEKQKRANEKEEKKQVWHAFTTDQLISIHDELMYVVGRVSISGVDTGLLEKELIARGIDIKKHENPILKGRPRNIKHYIFAVLLLILGGLISSITNHFLGGGPFEEIVNIMIFTSIFSSAFFSILNPQGNVVLLGVWMFLFLVIFILAFEYFSILIFAK